MLLSSLFTCVLATAAVASPLAPRTAAGIVSGIATLQSDIVKLNKTLNTFKANDVLSGITALQIQSQTTTVQNDLSSLIKTTNGTGNLNSDDTSSVANAVVNLEPYIQSLLNNIVVHKPAFATGILLVGDLSKTVLQSLQTQQALSLQFGNVLVPKLAEPIRDFAPLVVNQINGYFTTAIAAYQKCTGLVCLPPIPSSL